MKTQIFIRTNGGPQIGLGHLVRCIALAHMLKDDFEITFFCREISNTIVAELQGGGFGISIIKEEKEFFGQLTSTTIAVLDGYNFNTTYQKQIKAKGCKLVCIDDLHDQKFVADLIINHAPGVNVDDYQAQPHTKFALGLEYSLVRPKFLEQAKILRQIEKIETVIICFGGADPKNLTKSVLTLVKGFDQFKKILVVLGSEYKFSENLKAIICDDNRVEYYQSVDENKMLELMLQAELAIVSASNISIEILHVGLILITGITIYNQKIMYNGLLKMDNVYGIGDFNQLDFAKLKTVIQEVLNFKTFPIHLKSIKQKPLSLQFKYVFNSK